MKMSPLTQNEPPPLPSVQQPPRSVECELTDRIRRFLHMRVPHNNDLDLVIETRAGTVILGGRVETLDTKRRCVEYCRHVAGVVDVIDEIDVKARQRKPRPK